MSPSPEDQALVDEAVRGPLAGLQAMRAGAAAAGVDVGLPAPRDRLELRQEPSGLRYYLDGRGVHAGDELELQVWSHPHTPKATATWILGRYEWSYNREDRPTFHVFHGWLVTSSDWPDVEPHTISSVYEIHSHAQLRWPPKEA